MTGRLNTAEVIEHLGSDNGASAAFDEIIERYSERLYWHIRRIVVSHEDAEDLLQETFVSAFTASKSFRGETEGSLIAWLYRIATNLALRSLANRKRWIFSSIDSVMPSLAADFDGEIDPSADEIAVALQRAVVELPVKQKLVFTMRYFDEMPFEEIAQATGMSVGTLKTNYHYAVKRIKEKVTTIEL